MAYETTYGSLLEDQQNLASQFLELDKEVQETSDYDVEVLSDPIENEDESTVPDDYEMYKQYYEENEAKSALGDDQEDMDFLDFLFEGDNKYQSFSVNQPSPEYGGGLQANPYNYAGSVSSGSFRDSISSRESGGNYQAVSPNSSARGKYQFIWSIHKDEIAKQTGAKSEKEFMNNPQAQEKYFDYWEQTTLNPSVQANLGKFREYYPNATEEDVKRATHFAGRGGLESALRNGTLTKPRDANGTSIDKYVYKMR